MKKNRLFALLLALCMAMSLLAGCCSSAADDDDDEDDSDRGERRADKVLLAVYVENGGARTGQYLFDYDFAGRLKRETAEYSIGDSVVYDFEYDKDGRLLKRSAELTDRQDDGTAFEPVEETLAYDEQGRMTQHLYGDDSGQPAKDVYEYDGDRITSMDRVQGDLTGTWLYTYREDEAGDLITMRSYQSDGFSFPETEVCTSDGTCLQSYNTYQGLPIILKTYDDPVLWVRSETLALPTSDYPRNGSSLCASLLDTAGNELFQYQFGARDLTRLYRDEAGYLIRAESRSDYGSEDVTTTHLVYGRPGDDPEALLQQQETPQPEPRPLSESQIRRLLSELPEEFVFTSGAGAWATMLTIAPDGTFSGMYSDSDMGVTGDGYPGGTRYICEFTGTLTDFAQLSDTVYSMRVDSISFAREPGEEYIEDGVKYICAEPYGLDNAQELRLYLPGTPCSELTDGFLRWVRFTGAFQTLPPGLFGLHNVNDDTGFYGDAPDSCFGKNYEAEYEGRKMAFWPSYYSDTSLVFWPEDGASEISLRMDLTEPEDCSLVALDGEGSGTYVVALTFASDGESVTAEVTSVTGKDLTPWGGTADGHLRVTLDHVASSY